VLLAIEGEYGALALRTEMADDVDAGRERDFDPARDLVLGVVGVDRSVDESGGLVGMSWCW
jgi:hypothetical protein